MSDEFNSDFDNDFTVHSLCSCGPGALMSPFMLVRTRSVGVAFYARADKECWCRLLCLCGSGALRHAV
ncbi:hypothetical protein ACFXTH_015791 [Malus domestica]